MLAPEVLFTPGSFAEEEADMRFTPPTPPGLPLELAKDGVLSPCVPRPDADCDGVGPDANLLLGRALSLLSEVLDISGPQLPPPPEGFS